MESKLLTQKMPIITGQTLPSKMTELFYLLFLNSESRAFILTSNGQIYITSMVDVAYSDHSLYKLSVKNQLNTSVLGEFALQMQEFDSCQCCRTK